MNPRWRVLIIDGDAHAGAAVAEAVTSEGGHVVGTTREIEAATRLLDLHRPDVTLLGASPGDGLEAARQVMAVHPCALVLLARSTDSQLAARASAVGVVGFLACPFRAAELAPALDLAVSHFRDLEAVRKENRDLRRKLESRRLIDRAKAVLIERLNLSEPEAHRRIQKAAMDTRRTMADVAQAVLVGEEPRGSRSPK